MSNEKRLKELETPFVKYPPVLFVDNESEIAKARAQWELEHKRTIGKHERVIVFIERMEGTK